MRNVSIIFKASIEITFEAKKFVSQSNYNKIIYNMI